MRLVAPLAVLAAAFATLVLTPASVRIFGLDHGEFAGVAMGTAMIVSFLTLTGRGGVGRALGSIAIWAMVIVGLVGVYTYRYDAADVLGRVAGAFLPDEPEIGAGGSVFVNRRLGGDFTVAARVNGARVSLIFDTGASVVVLTGEDARRAGVRTGTLSYDVPVSTANGMAMAASVRLDEVAIGPIAERNVRALVAKPGALEQSLLGMSFLERLKSYSVERSRLVFTQR